MSTATQNIVNKAWNFAHVLRDDGLSYMAYTEQITFLLFLKMADELTKPPYNRKPIVPPALGLAEPDEARRRRTGSPLPARPGRTWARSRGCWAKSSRRPGPRSRTRPRSSG